MFNHHQDCLLYLWKAFRELGIEIHVAREELTNQLGFPPGGIKNNMFRIADELFTPEQIYPEFKDIIYSNNWVGYDKYVSIIPNDLFGEKTWWDCQMQSELKAFNGLNVLKTCNHPNAEKFGFDFCPNWVPNQPELKEKKYISQIISLPDLVEETKELINLKNKGYDVKIVGSRFCLDGFQRDIDILPYTSLLVHNKKVGINCYAVCKALDTGIPVYMERSTKELIGFGDLPDELFLFKDDMDIEEAFKISQNIDNNRIKEIYRGIYSFERTVKAVEEILYKKEIVPENIEAYHFKNCKTISDINLHLPVLLEYAKKCKTICEMGVRNGISTWTFLYSRPKKLVSYDIEYSRDLEEHKKYAKNESIDFEYIISDVLKTEINEYDFIFIDTWHTYSQLKKELQLHAKKAKKYLGFHDVFTFGQKGEDGKDWGLIPAIMEFLQNNPEWKISYYTVENNGLLILEK
jgi:predicted O-methyltransferase YrrM